MKVVEWMLLLALGLASWLGQVLLEMPMSLDWPLQLPNALVPLVLLQASACYALGLGFGLRSSLAVVVLVQMVSFPWWTRGWGGVMLGMAYGLASYAFIAFSQRSQADKWWLFQRAAVSALSAAMLLSCASVTHLSAMLVMVLPAAVLFSIFTFTKRWVNNQLLGDGWILGSLSLLLCNASVRYVQSPDAELPEQWLLRSAVFIFLLSPALRVLVGSWRQKLGRVLGLMLPALCALLALWVYLQEPVDAPADQGYDYGAFE